MARCLRNEELYRSEGQVDEAAIICASSTASARSSHEYDMISIRCIFVYVRPLPRDGFVVTNIGIEISPTTEEILLDIDSSFIAKLEEAYEKLQVPH